MRVSLFVTALAISVPALAAGPAPVFGTGQAANCPRTTSHLADQAGVYRRGEPLVPRKLTELPPATAYMAVYRVIDGCEAPLTMVEYRGVKRR